MILLFVMHVNQAKLVSVETRKQEMSFLLLQM